MHDRVLALARVKRVIFDEKRRSRVTVNCRKGPMKSKTWLTKEEDKSTPERGLRQNSVEPRDKIIASLAPDLVRSTYHNYVYWEGPIMKAWQIV